jgi:hypothetical protein
MNVLTGEAVALARCLFEVRNHLQNRVPSDWKNLLVLKPVTDLVG